MTTELTEDQVMTALKTAIDAAGSQRAFADAHNISASFLNGMLKRRERVSAKVMSVIGFPGGQYQPSFHKSRVPNPVETWSECRRSLNDQLGSKDGDQLYCTLICKSGQHLEAAINYVCKVEITTLISVVSTIDNQFIFVVKREPS